VHLCRNRTGHYLRGQFVRPATRWHPVSAGRKICERRVANGALAERRSDPSGAASAAAAGQIRSSAGQAVSLPLSVHKRERMIRGQALPRRVMAAGFIIALLLLAGAITKAEDGYRLWLRYDPLPGSWIDAYRPRVASVVVPGSSATLNAIRAELIEGCTGLFGSPVAAAGIVDRDGAVIVGTPQSSPLIAGLKWPLAELGPEGFRISSVRLNGRAVTVIAANSEVGALYGAFHFLRLIQTLQPINNLDVSQKPRLMLRMLNHWDNLKGTVERGYARHSLWKWEEL